jgi:hypothetical protein
VAGLFETLKALFVDRWLDLWNGFRNLFKRGDRSAKGAS